MAEKGLPLPSKSISKQLSDVGQYSYASLCTVSLRQLFEDEWHKKFKEDTLTKILKHLEQPDQVCESIRALLEGHGSEEAMPYVDLLFEEKMLTNGEPIITDLVTMAIMKGVYDSRVRVLVKHVSWQLRVSWDVLEAIESELAETLCNKKYVLTEEEEKEKKRTEMKSKVKRIALISLATIGGGTLIGLTGGLAAPLMAAGAGALIGGAGAAALGTTTGIAIIGSLFGMAGAGLTGIKMSRRVGAIEEFEFEPFHMENVTKQLHITIAVTGWLSSTVQDFRQPWQCLAESREQYALRWESRYLTELGQAFDYILSGAMTMATQEALKYTILSGLLTAIAWPAALLSAANVIDNPWSVAVQRANSAGKELAEVLLSRQQGKRPVTLIGFSLGARVIFTCLEQMCTRKGSEGIIEDVILLGTPVSGDPKFWKPLERVVGGKIINGYCHGDWLLKFLYRTSSVQMRIAGLGPVKWNNRRMHNIDLSAVVSGHSDYMKQLDVIMKVVGVRTKDELKPSSSRQSIESVRSGLSTRLSPIVDTPCSGSVEMEVLNTERDSTSPEGWDHGICDDDSKGLSILDQSKEAESVSRDALEELTDIGNSLNSEACLQGKTGQEEHTVEDATVLARDDKEDDAVFVKNNTKDYAVSAKDVIVLVKGDTVSVKCDTISVKDDTISVNGDTLSVKGDTVSVEDDTVSVKNSSYHAHSMNPLDGYTDQAPEVNGGSCDGENTTVTK